MAAAAVWLNDPRCGCFAAVDDGEPVGYIVGWLQPVPGIVPGQIGLVSEIAIDAHGYYGGAGRELAGRLRAWFAERGAQQMAVVTPHFDAVSQAFWRSFGAAEWMDILWIR